MKLTDRRLKIVYLPADQIVAALQGRLRLISPLLPEDATVISVHDDFWKRCFAVVFHSDSFDPVSAGETLPVIEPVEWFAVPQHCVTGIQVQA